MKTNIKMRWDLKSSEILKTIDFISINYNKQLCNKKIIINNYVVKMYKHIVSKSIRYYYYKPLSTMMFLVQQLLRDRDIIIHYCQIKLIILEERNNGRACEAFSPL